MWPAKNSKRYVGEIFIDEICISHISSSVGALVKQCLKFNKSDHFLHTFCGGQSVEGPGDWLGGKSIGGDRHVDNDINIIASVHQGIHAW